MYLSGCPVGQEVVPECEVVLESDKDDLTDRYAHCQKHPEHANFIPVSKFSVEHLPPEHRNLTNMDEIFRRCALTLRIKVSYTSLDRPNTFADSKAPYPFSKFRGSHRAVRYGTGTIVQAFYHHKAMNTRYCPCHLCKESGQPEKRFWWIRVRTATHVIHDRSEAEKALFDCFFDTDDRNGVRTIYGFDTFNAMIKSGKKYHNDVSDVLCVTHDWSTMEALSRVNPKYNFLYQPTMSLDHAPANVIVSHPHGCSKKLTVGNILHLTVPIGGDYHVDCEIPLKKGTLFRKLSHDSLDLEPDTKRKKSLHENESAAYDDAFGLQNYNLKEKLDSVINSCHETNVTSVNTGETFADKMDVIDPREKYLVDFYNLFLRDHCLKILLVCAHLHQRNDQRQKGGKPLGHLELLKLAFEEVFLIFLGKKVNVSADEEDDCNKTHNSQSQMSDSDLVYRYWLKLWQESDKEYAIFKSMNDLSLKNTDSYPSLIVSWFAEVEKIMDSVVLVWEKEGKILNEDVLPPVVDAGLKAGIKILMMYEGLTKNEVQQIRVTEPCGDDEGKDGKETNYTRVDKKGDNDKDEDGDNEIEEEVEEEGDNTDYQTVPDGATFTLPPDAPHAFQIYGDNPGWTKFPQGTVMNTPDGKREEIGFPLYEFKHPSMQPEQCYVLYNINTCPGSSGANVYCSLLGKSLGTYFPHSGHVSGPNNRSGIRDNFYTLFSKMLLFDPGDILNGCDGGSRKEPPGLIEGSKLIMQNLKEILSK